MENKNSKNGKIKTRKGRINALKGLLEMAESPDIRSFLNAMEPEDIAEILRAFSAAEKLRIFDLLDAKNAAIVLDDTDPQTQLQILQKIDDKRLAEVLDTMPVDEAADIVEGVPEKARDNILDLMEEKGAEEVEEILSYPEDSAARVMNPEFVYAREKDTIEKAVRYIRSLKTDEEFLYVYVVDEDMKLKGTVPIRKFLTMPKETLVKDIMENGTDSIFINEDKEKAAMIMKKYDLFSLPVVDANGCLVGRITVDDIMDVMDEERGEDISKMTGTIKEEHGTETAFRAARNRLPWLITCMMGSILTGLVIRAYEITLAETIALVSFIPVITATGGNSGVQASTVVVREIALGYMGYTKVWEEIWRQIKIASGLGIVCGSVLTTLANAWLKNGRVGVIVGLSLFFVVIWSNFVGVLTPVVFKKIRIDPAIASGPLITTLNDVTGVFIYLTIATYFLK